MMAQPARDRAEFAPILGGILKRALPHQLSRLLDRGLSGERQVNEALAVRYLGGICNHPNPTAYALVGGGSPEDERFASSIHALRRAVRDGNNHPCQIVAVTSALPADGKTTSTIAIARSAALTGLRTLLIDFDIRRASVTALLRHAPRAGLLEVLAAQVDLECALIGDSATSLKILPLKAPNGTLANIFVSPEMARLLQRLRLEFDLILFDCAPILVIADTRHATRLADTVILVARWRKTPVSAVCAAVRTLRQAGIDVKGLALTRTPAPLMPKRGFGSGFTLLNILYGRPR
jgi:succinoglycan biosynthesis transport protein ExoP